MGAPSPFHLGSKNIIITGASSGIGRQCAISCSLLGANLVLLGRNLERLKETLSLMDEPARHKFIAFDLMETEKIQSTLAEIVEKTGPVNGLIHSAGLSTTLPLKLVDEAKLDLYFKTNVQSGILLAKEIVKKANMHPEGGSLVFISSVMGSVGEKGKSLYGMTKGALNAACKSLAIELSYRKIRVNTLSPGVVISPMSNNSVYSQDQESRNKIEELHPLGFGQPEDVANACTYLLSDASKWITGTDLIVDGGYSAR